MTVIRLVQGASGTKRLWGHMPLRRSASERSSKAPVAHRSVTLIEHLGKAWTKGPTALSIRCPWGQPMEGANNETSYSTITVRSTGTNQPSMRWTHGTPIEKLASESSSGIATTEPARVHNHNTTHTPSRDPARNHRKVPATPSRETPERGSKLSDDHGRTLGATQNR